MTNEISCWRRCWRYLATAKHLRIVRYGLVGVSNASVCSGTMFLGALLGLNYLQYTVFGYSVAILYSFFMNLRFTFRVSGHIKTRLLMFLGINFMNLAVVEWIEYTMIEHYKMNHLLSIVCAMIYYSLMGFTLSTLLVYRDRKTQ